MLKNFMHPSPSPTDSSWVKRTSYDAARPADTVRATSSADAAPSAPNEDGNKLIVGPNIKLKGSAISDCAILVAGRGEASMTSRDIRIAEGGVFSGKAEEE